MVVLVLAGELIFGLPFHTARFFRPTYLEVFGWSNTQLGDVFAVYGITAMLAYFPGGVIADHYSPRSLMTFSLFATAAGGLYMATFPGYTQMALLYGFWGVSTVLLFWSAMISATRMWGGRASQGKAFGILDGGRGLTAAVFAVFAVAVLSHYMPVEAGMVSEDQRLEGFRAVVLLYSAAAALCGCLIWLVLPRTIERHGPRVRPWSGMLEVVRRPIVWAMAIVIICAYCGYKGADNYSLYAVQVLGMDEVSAARLTAYAAYLRPLAAICAGLLADRFCSSVIIKIMFAILVVSYTILAFTSLAGVGFNFILMNLLITFFAVYALRGIYFALLEESEIPKNLTGSTVGFVSLVGYTPDIFFASIGGRILDSAPVVIGHQRYFMFLAVLALLGVLAVSWLVWLKHKHHTKKITIQ